MTPITPYVSGYVREAFARAMATTEAEARAELAAAKRAMADPRFATAPAQEPRK